MTEYTRFKGGNPFGSQSKMLYHLDRIQQYIRDGDTYPLFMEVNLTSKCNLNCEWCISANFNRKDSIKTDSLINFLKEYHNLGGKAITFSGGGEPTLHPDFIKISVEASHIGLELGLMTNGVYPKTYTDIIGKYFKWARFSLDTINCGKYKKWKGIDKVEQVLQNIKSLKEYPIRTGINCNIHKEHSLDDVIELTKLIHSPFSLHIDESSRIADYIQFRPILPRYFKNETGGINEEVWDWLENYEIGRNSYVFVSEDKYMDLISNDSFNFSSCEGHFFEPVLDANGDICVCMYHPNDKRFVFGSIYEQSFEEIWKSDRRKKVIDFVRKLDYTNECQACCKLAEINKFLDFVNHPEKGIDINFL